MKCEAVWGRKWIGVKRKEGKKEGKWRIAFKVRS